MPGRSNIATRLLTETLVYWGTPTPDGTGGYTYAAPVEVAGRWEERSVMFRDGQGRELVSRAVVYVASDVVVQGLLYRGPLSDLTTAEQGAPETVETWSIREFQKVPRLDGSVFVRKAFL